MTKLDELMELNKAVDVIINSAEKDNENTEKEIVATEIELWNKMWNDIEEWYRKGYVDAAINDYHSSIKIPYGYYDNTIWTYKIKLFKRMHHTPLVYLDISSGHREIKRTEYLIVHEYFSEHITKLLLNWKETKNKIEQELVNSIAENIKRKTKETENTINYNNALLEALKNITEGEGE